MARVREMINKSKNAVLVELTNGTQIFVDAGGRIEDEDVANLDDVRKYFKVTEDLGEPTKSTGRRILNG